MKPVRGRYGLAMIRKNSEMQGNLNEEIENYIIKQIRGRYVVATI